VASDATQALRALLELDAAREGLEISLAPVIAPPCWVPTVRPAPTASNLDQPALLQVQAE
jgi:hypothetical protein